MVEDDFLVEANRSFSEEAFMKKHMLLIPVIGILVCVLATSSVSSAPQDRDSAFPFDLAFTAKSFPYEDRPVLSSNAKYLVYPIFTPPIKSESSKLESEPRYLPNGTPATSVGSRLWITEIATGRTNPLIPGEINTWRPSFSPDDNWIAFYSDKSGFPQLHLYNVSSGKARKVSDAKIKDKLWPGGEAFWSPNGKEVYVPVDIVNEVLSPEKTHAPKSGAQADPNVSVYRAGQEVERSPDED